jgi:hypothetical protein
MLERGQLASAPTFNNLAQIVVNSNRNTANAIAALETQIAALESRIAAAAPNSQTLVNNANTLRSQVNAAIGNNEGSNTALDSIQNNLTTNNQNADIQAARISPLSSLIDALTIGGEIQGFSDLLTRIAAATRVSSRILGTDANSNIVWRTQGSVGSGVLLRMALLSRRLTDTGNGGAATSLQAWNPILLDNPTFNNVGIIFNNTTKEFNIPAGEYMVFGFTTGASNGLKCRLRNIGSGAILLTGSPAKGTTAAAVIGSEPVNFISRMLGTFYTNTLITAIFESYFDTAAAVAGNTRGASPNLSGYTPQQSALAFVRVIY